MALAAMALMLALAGACGAGAAGAHGESARLGEAIVDASVAEVKAIRDNLLKAIDTIKGSRLGIVSGAQALYELPVV
jgi:type VI secretion system protein ImpL